MINKTAESKSFRISLLGILTSIILIQTFVPFLGNIPIPPLNPTIIHITVIIAALTMSTKDGMIIGAVWGMATMVRAYTMPASPLSLLLWTHPLIALFPRVLIGLFTGMTFRLLQKLMPQKEKLALASASVVGSFTNTIFVLLFIYLLFGDTYAQAVGVDVSNLVGALAVVVGTNGVAEAVAAAIIAPLVTIPLRRITYKSK
ncbi:Substrate-specific component PanT of predicted pantothenate ECF transporter [Alkalibacterium sp. AK22]|uniref:ECF transporter S component n=1 Tax=Alkalibacterium sp. AK22 TaxID=1229520 RepID=UPI00044DFA51|nr:ECF transporter S component [Alkalibacterium sp. AK22]EXJ22494.1 Substrate-specific component PanT of predicted pantothenate ECF transporter [Alkalibacterium sp. AK22]